MARRKEPGDDELRRRLVDSVRDLGEDASELVGDRVMEVLRPLIGAAAERRRNEGALREAFREGYLMGQQSGRWNRWHVAIWKASGLFKRLRAQTEQHPHSIAAAAKFSDYNY